MQSICHYQNNKSEILLSLAHKDFLEVLQTVSSILVLRNILRLPKRPGDGIPNAQELPKD
jgi:hypothetical protein